MPCPGTEHLFSEKVYRLGRVPCSYRPLDGLVIADPPYFRNGYVTFGCFNDPRKITRDVAQLWSVILHMLPDTKLFLKYDRLERDIVQARLREWFAGYGIAGDRLGFAGSSEPREYFAAWNEIDIALDPFPYNGGTTTMDALWMGVPVVTMPGRLAVACGGDSLLSAVGLPIARTPEEYVSLAATLAKTIPASPDIRQRVRQAMTSSALLDESGLVRSIEAAYREMWRTWCASQASH